jgi:hypothetical protein
VLDYGAVPNDGASDVAAITCAILAASNGSGTGGTVYFPPGEYDIDTTIDLNGLGVGAGRIDGIKLLGSSAAPPASVGGAGGGTVLRAMRGIAGPVLRGDAARVSIEGMTLDGNGLANPVLQFWYLSTAIDVRNVVLTGAPPAVGPSCVAGATCTSLVQLDGNRFDPGGGCPGGSCEVDNVVFQNVFFAQITTADYDLDVVGSNTFRIMVRDSRLTGANDLVHVVAGSIDLDNDDLAPPPTANGSIRLDSLVQHMTVSNCYTEVSGPKFLYQGYVQPVDGQNVVHLIGNTTNAIAPIVIVPNQMFVLDGNLLKGNVVVNAGGPTYGKQTVVAVGNQFGGNAYFAGTAQAQIQQLGTVTTQGAVSSVLSTAWLSGPTSVGGLLQMQQGGQIAYRVTTGGNQPYWPPQDFSPANWDEVRAPTMLAAATWAVEPAGATPGARIRFVKTSPDSYPITIAQHNPDDTYTNLTTINSTPGSNGWVELVLVAGSPNAFALSAWGKN